MMTGSPASPNEAMMDKLRSLIHQGRAANNVHLRRAEELSSIDEDRFIDECGEHFDLMRKWNRVHNLSRVTEPSAAAEKHYYDCLLASAYIEGTRIIDIGSGAGFPGLILAILRPKTAFLLVDAAQKRCLFLGEARRVLGLKNVSVEHGRYEKTDLSGTVTSRATISAEKLKLAPLVASLSKGSRLALMLTEVPELRERWTKLCKEHGLSEPSYEVYNRLEQDRVILGARLS